MPSTVASPIRVEIELRSLDPNIPVSKAVAALRKSSAELANTVSTKYPNTRVAVRRKEGFPATPDVLAIIVEFIHKPEVISGIKTGAVAFFVRESLTYVTNRFPDMQAKAKQFLGVGAKPPAKKKAAAKKASAKKKQAKRRA
ncbi:MAG: hypothetical protein U0Q16_27865 [Bryobacteraceae bacterium]